jgi:hypothetical protein
MAKKFKLNIKQEDGTFVEYKLDISTDDVMNPDGSKSLSQVLTEYSTTKCTNVDLGQGYAFCDTKKSVIGKVAILSGYTAALGGIISVKFTDDVPTGSTLNINSEGAKAIYFRGDAITTNIIKAGDIATFIYDGTNYILISIDRWQNDLTTHTHNIIQYQDTREVDTTPRNVPAGLSVHLKKNIADGLEDGGQYHSTIMAKGWSSTSGGTWGQLAVTQNNNLYFRSSVEESDTDWQPWQKAALDGHEHPDILEEKEITDNVLDLTIDKYQYVEDMVDGTTINLPSVSTFTEIHLFFNATSDLTLVLPDALYQKIPEIQEGCSYEFIFTYIPNKWLAGYIEYGADDNA